MNSLAKVTRLMSLYFFLIKSFSFTGSIMSVLYVEQFQRTQEEKKKKEKDLKSNVIISLLWNTLIKFITTL